MKMYLDSKNRGARATASAASSFYSREVEVSDELYTALLEWAAKNSHVDAFLERARQKASMRTFDINSELTDVVKDILCLDTTEAANEVQPSKQDSPAASSKQSTSSSSKKASRKKTSDTKSSPSA